MKRVFCSLLIILLLTACAQQTTNTVTWQEQYDLGMRYLTEGNYAEAIIAFTAAIEIDPKQAPAYVGRGDAYTAKAQLLASEGEGISAAAGDYRSAVDDYLVAIELDGTDAEIYLKAAGICELLGETDEAAELLERGFNATGDTRLQEELDRLRGEETSEPIVMQPSPENDFLVGNVLSFGDLPNWVDCPFDRLDEYLPVRHLEYREKDDNMDELKRLWIYEYTSQDAYYNDVDAYASPESDSLTSLWFTCREGVPTGFKGVNTGDSFSAVIEKLGIEDGFEGRNFTDLYICLSSDGQSYGRIYDYSALMTPGVAVYPAVDSMGKPVNSKHIFVYWVDPDNMQLVQEGKRGYGREIDLYFVGDVLTTVDYSSQRYINLF